MISASGRRIKVVRSVDNYCALALNQKGCYRCIQEQSPTSNFCISPRVSHQTTLNLKIHRKADGAEVA